MPIDELFKGVEDLSRLCCSFNLKDPYKLSGAELMFTLNGEVGDKHVSFLREVTQSAKKLNYVVFARFDYKQISTLRGLRRKKRLTHIEVYPTDGPTREVICAYKDRYFLSRIINQPILDKTFSERELVYV